MTTCTWSFRRHATRILVVATITASGVGFSAQGASADQLSSLRAQAQAVADKIQTLGRQEAALGEQYDAASLAVQAAQAKVTAAAHKLDSAEASAAHARSVLGKEALDAYTGGGTSRALSGAATLGTATASLLGAEYVDSLAATERDAIDQYRLASAQARDAKASLTQAEAEARTHAAQLDQARQQAQATQGQLQGVYHQEQGQIATLVAQIQAQQEAAARAAAAAAAARAAQAAAAAAAARQAAAAQAASQSAVQTVSAPSAPPPPPGHGASGAVSAALSRLGDPYVWGASGPNAFDCSGLVMWAYEQVGISLPHFSGAQYSDGVHIPMSDLQPGDLVFPSNPGEHVAMYIGGGQIVEAPYTGATVHVIPLSSWFVQAVRIA